MPENTREFFNVRIKMLGFKSFVKKIFCEKFKVETFEKRSLLPNFCACPVKCAAYFFGVSLKFYPPPNFGGLILEILNVFLPAP